MPLKLVFHLLAGNGTNPGANHHNDVIMGTMASQITSLAVVNSSVYSDADQRKHQTPRHWPLCGEFTGTGELPTQRASYAENVSIWWRHHGVAIWISAVDVLRNIYKYIYVCVCWCLCVCLSVSLSQSLSLSLYIYIYIIACVSIICLDFGWNISWLKGLPVSVWIWICMWGAYIDNFSERQLVCRRVFKLNLRNRCTGSPWKANYQATRDLVADEMGLFKWSSSIG